MVSKKYMNCSSTAAALSDYDYIIKIIQHLENKHGISFFITTRDFDTLYRWWEKRIPLKIIEESISNVVVRWQAKKKRVTSFSTFYYEVKKNFKFFLELDVGAEDRDEESTGYENIEYFFLNYPDALLEIKDEFAALFRKLKAHETYDLAALHDKLQELFENDRELNLKVELFIKNLAPRLRSPEIKKKYRLNYLLNKFHIPDFNLYGE